MGFRKIEIGKVKTTTRIRQGETQTIKLYSKFQKREIIREVGKGTSRYDLRVEDVLSMYGVSAPVYYSWLRKDKKSEPHSVRLVIEVRSNTNLVSLSEKLKEIEEIENVYFK